MAIDTLAKNPMGIRTLEELDELLLRISSYERERDCSAGVLLIQRRQFGGIYRIKSVQEAQEWLSRPVYDDGKGNHTCEWGVKFYPRSYFEELRKKFNGGF